MNKSDVIGLAEQLNFQVETENIGCEQYVPTGFWLVTTRQLQEFANEVEQKITKGIS